MRRILIVAAGGATGASGRWLISELMPADGRDFPWATLLVNVAGCLCIGVAARRLARDSDAWAGLVVGLLGGLTTFSTFAVETRQLLDAGRPWVALLYLTATPVAGMLATDVARHGRSVPT